MNFLSFTHLYMDKNLYKFVAIWVSVTLIVHLLIVYIKKIRNKKKQKK